MVTIGHVKVTCHRHVTNFVKKTPDYTVHCAIVLTLNYNNSGGYNNRLQCTEELTCYLVMVCILYFVAAVS